ncbi:DUF2827 family protein [Actinobacillus equuli]|uniref:DUF2827 family protein n=1 Tax=Actinobacillus equuli TaxID=718 RepID=UPI002441A670|nr:DUF2827 family protein [Actinobacillus equuli]WGE64865.1 DUF2827 domain-containing protein [Actinobacillus equuli subsp. equuli]WGE78840.1 DUF2827 domain-containing protein [Actinobacillus equuli subsp. equuli]WGE82996.1 DUF2827 domain-containing protein [Actinobacillus equuli subsp. equuli]
MSRKYKIGITFNLESSVTDIWANGANQNIIFLYQLFSYSNIVENVVLVSWGPEKRTTPPDGFMLDKLNLKFAYIDDVIDELDVLIEGTLVIEPHHVEKMHGHNGKVVCYKIGNDFIMDMENFLFEKKSGRVFNGTHFDSVWMIPQHENTCHSYFSIMYRCNSYVVPAIWAPTFCDQVIKRLKEKHNLEFGYKPTYLSEKRIASFEANINIVKTSFIPVLICEQAYRTVPEKIKHVYLCNTYEKRNNPTFFNFIGRTNLVKNKIMTVEGRYQMPDFLTRYVDIVVSHQWENGLNYAYNDALYGGYPFIHNSKLLPKGVGYYYDQFDAFDGAKVLLDVIDNHDKDHEAYVKRANEYLDSLLPTNPVNIYLYEKEIKRLFE